MKYKMKREVNSKKIVGELNIISIKREVNGPAFRNKSAKFKRTFKETVGDLSWQ